MLTPTDTRLTVFGDHEANTIHQMEELIRHGSVVSAALLSDGHHGYSMPIGGVVAYSDHVSVTGVGFDVACGNKAVKTDLTYWDVKHRLDRIADEVYSKVIFGVGQNNPVRVDHELFDSDAWGVLKEVAGDHEHDSLKAKARNQLGTVGTSNHYLDFFIEQSVDGSITNDSPVWVGVHFGSRGFGHGIASGFLKLEQGIAWGDRNVKETESPALLELDSDLGQAYHELMVLAGEYAYAGRNWAVQTALDVVGATELDSVHNNHNFAWKEEHGGRELWVVRKGATPLWPGQRSFIGGSMCGTSVVVRGIDRGNEMTSDLYSTVHGAGRIMGRMAAKGKKDKATGKWKREPGVREEDFRQAVKDSGIELRGGAVDESPFVYRQLEDVLVNHQHSTHVETRLRPILVCMAGAETRKRK